jgi:membrane protein required for colicin V production
MQTLDIFLLLPILWGAYTGYERGILIEIISVVAFVVSIILGFRLWGSAVDWLSPYLSSQVTQRLLPYVGFSMIFFPIIFLINKLGWTLRRSIRYTIFGSFDSMAGAIVGSFTWAFGLSVFLWLATSFGVKIKPDSSKTYYVYPVVKPLAPRVIDYATGMVKKFDNPLKTKEIESDSEEKSRKWRQE